MPDNKKTPRRRLQGQAEGGFAAKTEVEREAREDTTRSREGLAAARDACSDILDLLDAEAEGQASASS